MQRRTIDRRPDRARPHERLAAPPEARARVEWAPFVLPGWLVMAPAVSPKADGERGPYRTRAPRDDGAPERPPLFEPVDLIGGGVLFAVSLARLVDPLA